METSTLFLLSSSGVLCALLFAAAWRWVPVLDNSLKKSIDQVLWPVAVKLDRLCYVLLNGESQPAVHPQPVITTRHFRLPISESKDGKDRGEAINDRARAMLWESLKLSTVLELMRTEESFRTASGCLDATVLGEVGFEADKRILVMLQDACKSGRIASALDLSRRLVTEKAVWSGIAIANHFGRTQLARNLQDLLEQRRDVFSASSRADDRSPANTRKDDRHLDISTGSVTGGSMNDRSKLSSSDSNRENYDSNLHGVSERDRVSAVPTNGLGLSKKLNARSAVFETPAVSKNAWKESEPDDNGTDHELESAVKPVHASNPFLRSSPLSPPLKRKNVFDTIKDLKTSPSPKKTAVLSVRFSLTHICFKIQFTDLFLLFFFLYIFTATELVRSRAKN
jgi:hypothetical protein